MSETAQAQGTSVFFVAERDAFMVVGFRENPLHTCVEDFENLITDVLGKSRIKTVVFNFQNVSDMHFDAVSLFAKFQLELRNRKSFIRICCLRDEMKNKLLNKGVIRHAEIFGSLEEALRSAAGEVKKLKAAG